MQEGRTCFLPSFLSPTIVASVDMVARQSQLPRAEYRTAQEECQASQLTSHRDTSGRPTSISIRPVPAQASRPLLNPALSRVKADAPTLVFCYSCNSAVCYAGDRGRAASPRTFERSASFTCTICMFYVLFSHVCIVAPHLTMCH